jgi:hypothetical protein
MPDKNGAGTAAPAGSARCRFYSDAAFSKTFFIFSH